MGMDVSGLCPRRDPGNLPDDAYRKEHWNQTLALRAHCGDYFRANIWEWRAILNLSMEAYMYQDALDIDFRPWQYNDGAGLRTQRECDLLAGAVESLVRSSFTDEDPDPFDADPFFADFLVYVDKHGEPYCVRPTDEEAAKSQYRTDGEHVWWWVAFLRNCGGFAIY
jgi:hypothetical protein